jgi:hypothetical protein
VTAIVQGVVRRRALGSGSQCFATEPISVWTIGKGLSVGKMRKGEWGFSRARGQSLVVSGDDGSCREDLVRVAWPGQCLAAVEKAPRGEARPQESQCDRRRRRSGTNSEARPC